MWHYRDADPDFGHWQAKELLDHLEGVLSNQPVEVASGQAIVEVKPQVRAECAAISTMLGCFRGAAQVATDVDTGGVQGRSGGAHPDGMHGRGLRA